MALARGIKVLDQAGVARVGLASKGSKCRVQENLLGALADPDLVDVAIEPGSVTDAAGRPFHLAA